MLAVIICAIFNAAVLIGLLAGLVAAVVQARGAIVTALASDPMIPAMPRLRAAAA